MTSFATLKRCMDISQRDIDDSMESRDAIKELLDAASAVSRPADGAPRVLLVFAQMAGGACEWLDGELRVELVEADDVTVIECMTDLGGGYRERVFPPIVMRAPIEEFRRASTVPEMIAPLIVKSSRDRRFVLVAEPQAEAPSMMAPAVEIGKENLVQGHPGTAHDTTATSGPASEIPGVKPIPRAPVPTFIDRVEPDDETHAEPEVRGNARASTPPPPTVRSEGDDFFDEAVPESVTASGTMIPMGLGAPPPPPIVHAEKRPSKGGAVRPRPMRADPRAEPSEPGAKAARAPSKSPRR